MAEHLLLEPAEQVLHGQHQLLVESDAGPTVRQLERQGCRSPISFDGSAKTVGSSGIVSWSWHEEVLRVLDRPHDFEPVAATSGEAARRLVEQSRPDVAVVDLDDNGRKLLEELREQEIACIAWGSVLSHENLIAALGAGASYVIKDENWPGAKHDRAGQLCMANRGHDTNGQQIFITDAAAPFLDGNYTIFGECSPVDAIHKIAAVTTSPGDRPVTPVTINHVTVAREKK